MTTPLKVHFIASNDGDWIGIYVNDVLKHQGHSLDECDVLEALNIEYTYEERNMRDGYPLPDTL